jgi:hypothetical protein
LDFFCKTQKALVVKELSESEIHASYEEFAASLKDTAAVGNKGLLHLFSLCTGQSVRFFRYGDSVKIYDMWYFWDAVETQAANLKVELWHLQNAQSNPAGKKELLDFLGDASKNPPTDGELQNTHTAEGNLVWPILPQGTVVNIKDHKQWITTYPGSVSPPACKFGLSSPPNGTGGIQGAPTLNETYVLPVPDGVGTIYKSPTQGRLTSLIDGWTAPSPAKWLADQTSTKLDDPPVTSIGFQLLSYNPSCESNGYPWVWTVTPAQNGYVVINMDDGKPQDPNSKVGVTGLNANWTFLVADFDYQFYWYQ